MIPYLPCETARELLEPLVDRELTTTDHVAVEAHLRVCGTCRARVEDLGLIGWSLRTGTPAISPAEGDARALGVVQSGVLERIRAERAQSWRAWLPELFSDMRLWWPAMGATAAVLLCFWGSVSIFLLTTEKAPYSMAALLDPGSDSNPMAFEAGMSLPRSIDQPLAPDDPSAADGMIVLTYVVNQNGIVGAVEMLRLHPVLPAASAGQAAGQAALEALRGSRFTPAQAADGRAVAIRLVMVIERTTIKETWRPIEENWPAQQARRTPVPKVVPQQSPSGVRSAVDHGSARA
jgi:hypothetical protein